MKEIGNVILNPFISALLLGVFLTFSLILYKYLSQARFYGKFEAVSVFFYVLLLMEIRIPPFSFLRPSTLAGVDKTPSSAAIQIGVYLFFILVFNARFQDFLQNSLLIFKDPLLTLILIFSLLSGFWSETPILSFKSGLVIVGISLFAAHIAKLYSLERLTFLFRQLSLYLLIPCILVSVAIPSIGFEPEKGGWQGIMRHPIALGTFAALSIALWLCHLLSSKKDQAISIGAIFVSFIALLGSKSSQAIFVVITLAMIIFIYHGFKRLPFRQGVVASVAFSTFSLCFGIALKYNSETVVAATGRDLTLTGRTEFWPQVIRTLNNHNPLFGFGISGFWQHWRGNESPARYIINPNGFVPPNAHNGFLDLALQIGWIGLLLFILSVLTVIIKSFLFAVRGSSTASITPLVFAVYILMANISETQLFMDTYIWFIYIFLAISPELNGNHAHSRNIINFDRGRSSLFN